MADMDAIREARRRRILQSSENRINRVLGKAQNDDESSQTHEVNRPPIISPAVVDGPSTDDSSTTLRQRLVTSDNNSEQARVPRSTVKISPLKRPTEQISQNDSNSTPNESLNSSRSSSDAKMILKHFEFLRIVMCVMVAYLCRRVLATGYGIFYVQSVVLPFACMEAAFFMFKNKVLHNVTLPHKSSMLIGVLMLCGIKPAILQTYNKMMGYFTAATEDFAMFFFAFMMANVFIT